MSKQKPKRERIKRLHIAVPNYRGVMESPFVTSLVSLFHFLGRRGDQPVMTCPTHTIVATARQHCINVALQDPNCSHVLFIDDDMVFSPDQYVALENEVLENDLDFCGALAFANSIPTKPCIFGDNPDVEAWGPEPWWYIMTDYPPSSRFQVSAAGFGMVLISKRMLEGINDPGTGHFQMPPGFMHLGHFVNDVALNEDVAFCLNARKKGYKLYVDSRVCIGHISKERPVIDENTYLSEGNAVEYHLGLRRTCPELNNPLKLQFKDPPHEET